MHKLAEHKNKETWKQQINNILADDQAKDNIIQQQKKDTEHKCQCRCTTDNEKKLLENLLKFDSFSEDAAIKVLRQLQDLSNDWDMQRVKIYYNNHKRK